MRKSAKKNVLSGSISVDSDLGSFLGDTRIRLLEAIETHGSISQAAKAVPLSYKAAWDAVDAINNIAPRAVVERSTGGKNGGGTALTDYGRRLIAFYRALEAEHQRALERLNAALGGSESAGSVQEFRQLVRSMSMKISARNQFAGTIVFIKAGMVDCEVILRLEDGLDIASVITQESVENLGLTVGGSALAYVKSSSILLAVEEGDEGEPHISARNRFKGTVSRINEGPVNVEVTLTLGQGKHVLTAVITHDSLDRLGLKVGSSAWSVFKAPSVFLATAN
ncbi:MAG: LysR family transcriptional regulator [Rhodocyclaceae bacterium]|nr:MAG: LysR family transcriptional regulator [Rhodocyclaceae bacterium]